MSKLKHTWTGAARDRVLLALTLERVKAGNYTSPNLNDVRSALCEEGFHRGDRDIGDFLGELRKEYFSRLPEENDKKWEARRDSAHRLLADIGIALAFDYRELRSHTRDLWHALRFFDCEYGDDA